MKHCFKTALLIIGLQLAFAPSSSAQKKIYIDELLKLNSEPMKAKRKGSESVGKYEFGSYKVVSGKLGWTEYSSKYPFFGVQSSTYSSYNKSFVFVNSEADTSIANIRVTENIETDDGNWFLHNILNMEDSEVQKGEGVFETFFAFSADTTLWILTVVYPLVVELDGMLGMDTVTYFRGILTDGDTYIEIREITESEDGKIPLLYPIHGYEFWEGSNSLAAVQVMPRTRMYVWIRDDLAPGLNFVLASSAAAMLIKWF